MEHMTTDKTEEWHSHVTKCSCLLYLYFTLIWSTEPGRYFETKMAFTTKWPKQCTLLDFGQHSFCRSCKQRFRPAAHLSSLIKDFAMCIRYLWIVDFLLKGQLFSTVRVFTDNNNIQLKLRPLGAYLSSTT